MWLLLALACHPWTDGDYDGDGFRHPRDCDDGDPRVHPDAPDPVGDEVDSNCDRLDGVDADGDGEASIGSGGQDCDDGDSEVHPEAEEVCNGTDDDCDGDLDEGASDGLDWYADSDGDGVGAGVALRACESPGAAFVLVGGDCEDADRAVYPGAAEPCGADLDCDGAFQSCDPLAGELGRSVVFTGAAVGSGTGWSVAAVGDVDGDGWGDLAVGARDLGQAWVLGGPFVEDGPVVSHAIVSLSGSAGAGVSVAGVGDVDGDGLADVLIGADQDAVGGANAGAAWLVHGARLGVDTFSAAALQLVGDPGASAGRSVAGPGDADGDGIADLLIGAPGAGPGGSAYLVSGSVNGNLNLGSQADLVLECGLPLMGAGWSVGGADLDGDGIADLVVGGPMALEGRTWAVTGDPGGIAQNTMDLDLADGQVRGEADGDLFGWSLSTGDANGDGRADLWVGAPGADGERGRAWLILGDVAPGGPVVAVSSAAEGSVAGLVPGERIGESVSFVPDIDGDGRDEVALAGMGAGTATAEDGGVWVFVGPAAGDVDLDDADGWIWGAASGDRLGDGLGAGDLNRDGRGDLVIGASGGGAEGVGPGELILIYGG